MSAELRMECLELAARCLRPDENIVPKAEAFVAWVSQDPQPIRLRALRLALAYGNYHRTTERVLGVATMNLRFAVPPPRPTAPERHGRRTRRTR